MSEDDWMPPKKSNSQIVVGEELTGLSLEDLEDRLIKLQAEIDRVELIKQEKKQQAGLAENLFKPET